MWWTWILVVTWNLTDFFPFVLQCRLMRFHWFRAKFPRLIGSGRLGRATTLLLLKPGLGPSLAEFRSKSVEDNRWSSQRTCGTYSSILVARPTTAAGRPLNDNRSSWLITCNWQVFSQRASSLTVLNLLCQIWFFLSQDGRNPHLKTSETKGCCLSRAVHFFTPSIVGIDGQ